MQGCDRPVYGEDKMCLVHRTWVGILADPRYRTEVPPVVTEIGIQGVFNERDEEQAGKAKPGKAERPKQADNGRGHPE